MCTNQFTERTTHSLQQSIPFFNLLLCDYLCLYTATRTKTSTWRLTQGHTQCHFMSHRHTSRGCTPHCLTSAKLCPHHSSVYIVTSFLLILIALTEMHPRAPPSPPTLPPLSILKHKCMHVHGGTISRLFKYSSGHTHMPLPTTCWPLPPPMHTETKHVREACRQGQEPKATLLLLV